MENMSISPDAANDGDHKDREDENPEQDWNNHMGWIS